MHVARAAGHLLPRLGSHVSAGAAAPFLALFS